MEDFKNSEVERGRFSKNTIISSTYIPELSINVSELYQYIIKSPSRYEELAKYHQELIPIAINQTRLTRYTQLKRFNIIFPVKILQQIDQTRKKIGLKRSTFLQKAAEAYLKQCEQSI